jgi:Arc/MetJ-type ribon-helix-helix transcriptional regulator
MNLIILDQIDNPTKKSLHFNFIQKDIFLYFFYIHDMITIPVQLSEHDLHKIDTLVQMGRYKSRNQAIRTLLADRLAQEIISFSDDTPEKIQERQKIIQELEMKRISPTLSILGKKSAVDIISESRDRKSGISK